MSNSSPRLTSEPSWTGSTDAANRARLRSQSGRPSWLMMAGMLLAVISRAAACLQSRATGQEQRPRGRAEASERAPAICTVVAYEAERLPRTRPNTRRLSGSNSHPLTRPSRAYTTARANASRPAMAMIASLASEWSNGSATEEERSRRHRQGAGRAPRLRLRGRRRGAAGNPARVGTRRGCKQWGAAWGVAHHHEEQED